MFADWEGDFRRVFFYFHGAVAGTRVPVLAVE